MVEDSTSEASLRYEAFVRLARREDIPISRSFIFNLAMEHDSECLMTEAILERELFRERPLDGLTIFILELQLLPMQAPEGEKKGATPNAEAFPSSNEQSNSSVCSLQSGACFPVSLKKVKDCDQKSFTSPVDGNRVIVGHLCLIPSYHSRVAMPALRIEDIYIRVAYRRQGLGRILLSAVARIASMEGIGRLDWLVHAGNHRAIEFYKSMRATVLEGTRSVKLHQEGIEALAKRP